MEKAVVYSPVRTAQLAYRKRNHALLKSTFAFPGHYLSLKMISLNIVGIKEINLIHFLQGGKARNISHSCVALLSLIYAFISCDSTCDDYYIVQST